MIGRLNTFTRVSSSLWLTFAVALALLALPATAQAVDVNSVERGMVSQINKYRKAKGKPRLELDVKLTKSAEWLSRDMAAYEYFSHTDRLGRDPFARLAYFKYPTNSWRGENLAAGNEGVSATLLQWKNSEGHRVNMVNGNFRAIGIARVYDADSPYGYYWTTTFGSKVTRGVRDPAVWARYTNAKRQQIRTKARNCAARYRAGSAAYKRNRCGWNLRTARKLGFR